MGTVIYDNAECLIWLSDGLPIPRVQTVSDRNASVGDVHQCQAHYNMLADSSTDEENAELEVLLLCQS